MGLSKIEALKWVGAFGKGFGEATAPYYGVNIFDVRPEHLEALVANVELQNGLARSIGAQLKSWTERDNRGLVRVAWIMSYQNGINPSGSGPLAIWRMRSFFPIWFEFCGLIESYEWFVTTELSSSTEEYLATELR